MCRVQTDSVEQHSSLGIHHLGINLANTFNEAPCSKLNQSRRFEDMAGLDIKDGYSEEQPIAFGSLHKNPNPIHQPRRILGGKQQLPLCAILHFEHRTDVWKGCIGTNDARGAFQSLIVGPRTSLGDSGCGCTRSQLHEGRIVQRGSRNKNGMA